VDAWGIRPGRDAVFVEDADGAEVLEALVVVVREVEAAVGDEPALIEVGAAWGTVRWDFGVGRMSFEEMGMAGALIVRTRR
jgi:hypothetical protein